MTTRRSRRWPAAAALAVVVLLLLAGAVLAQSPSSGAAASPAPAATASPVATASGAPCPNPTPHATPTLAPGQTPGPTRHPNLCPAEPNGADPLSLLATLFTPIFQLIFLALVFAYRIVGDIGIAIVVVTIVIRILLVPVYRRQIVSQRRMQMLQPELKQIAAKYKGDRSKVSEEQMRLYKERGINPAAGCLPTLVTMVLLLPMYYVFSSGLTAPNISSMLHVFGVQLIDVPCQAAAAAGGPCINPTVHWLPDIATGQLLNASQPEILFRIPLPLLGSFGFSVLAFVSAMLQLLQTRMMMPSTTDPQARTTQNTMMLLPLFSLVYGSFLPAGLFIYWIVTTIFSVVQQYLIAGWGSLFPLFGWTPAFATRHVPSYPVLPPPPKPAPGGKESPTARRTPLDSAAGTLRPNRDRTRTSRRGRRR